MGWLISAATGRRPPINLLAPRWRRHSQRNVHEVVEFLLVFATQQDRQHPHKAVGYFLLLTSRIPGIPGDPCSPSFLRAERIHPSLVITFAQLLEHTNCFQPGAFFVDCLRHHRLLPCKRDWFTQTLLNFMLLNLIVH